MNACMREESYQWLTPFHYFLFDSSSHCTTTTVHHHHCALPGTKLTVTTVSSATENSRCVGITDGGSAPSSTQIFAGTDSTGTTSAKTATVQCTGGGATSCVLEMTGLVPSTPHDVYCTTNGGVVSSKLDVNTLGDTDCDSLGSCSVSFLIAISVQVLVVLSHPFVLAATPL